MPGKDDMHIIYFCFCSVTGTKKTTTYFFMEGSTEDLGLALTGFHEVCYWLGQLPYQMPYNIGGGDVREQHGKTLNQCAEQPVQGKASVFLQEESKIKINYRCPGAFWSWVCEALSENRNLVQISTCC